LKSDFNLAEMFKQDIKEITKKKAQKTLKIHKENFYEPQNRSGNSALKVRDCSWRYLRAEEDTGALSQRRSQINVLGRIDDRYIKIADVKFREYVVK